MKDKIKNIILWVIGIFFILSFIAYWKTILIPSILILISGILVLPPVNNAINKKLEEKNNVKKYKTAKIILVVTFFLVFFSNVPAQEVGENSLVNDTNSISSSEETGNNTPQQTEINQPAESMSNIITETNGKYTGQRVDGKKQGYGKYEWNDGSVYEGEFKDDKINGQGKLTIPEKGIYEGNFSNSKKSGQGTYMFINKDKYIGNWEDDKMSGQGTYTFSNGDTYVGEFSDNKFNGQGTYTKDGKEYSGTWSNNEYKK